MKHQVIIILIAMVFSLAASSHEQCGGLSWDGEDSVEFKIGVFEPWTSRVSGADVRFVTLGRKGYATKTDWNTVVSKYVVKGITNSDGYVTLSPKLQTHGYDPVEGDPESCKETKGFYGGDVYLIITKQGYHTYSAGLSSLLIKTSFEANEKMKGRLVVNLLPKRI